MASQGLVKTFGSRSTGRAPGFSSRVKHECKLVNRCFRASLRSRSANSRQIAIEARASGRASIWLNQAKNRFVSRRGIRLVSRKLISSRSKVVADAARLVIFLKKSSNNDCVHEGGNHHRRRLRPGCYGLGGVGGRPDGSAGSVQGEAQIARRARAHRAARGVAGAVLSVRRSAVLQG